jgi:hypothetical protein
MIIKYFRKCNTKIRMLYFVLFCIGISYQLFGGSAILYRFDTPSWIGATGISLDTRLGSDSNNGPVSIPLTGGKVVTSRKALAFRSGDQGGLSQPWTGQGGSIRFQPRFG